MKRIISIVLCTVMLLGSINVTASELYDDTNEVTNVIKLLGVANGDENGNMNYDHKVTRAQFVKMAVCASTHKDSTVNTKVNVSLFYDVKSNYWGAGYISTAISAGLVNGYLDGTFRPDNAVKLEEAVTVVLKMLGYTSSDFKGPYPSSQIETYESLKLDKEISASVGDDLTRIQCMQLLYNALSAKTKSGAVYCTTLGYTANSDGELDYTALVEEKTKGPVVVLDSSSWESAIPFDINGSTSIVLEGKGITKSDIKVNDVLYYSDILNSVAVYRKTATGVVTSISTSNNSPVSVSLTNKTYTLSTNSVKDMFSVSGEFGTKDSFVTLILGRNDAAVHAVKGDISSISSNTDNADYLDMVNATVSAPIVVSSNEDLAALKNVIPFEVNDECVYLNGVSSGLSQVKINDVIYYSVPFESVWVFRDTLSGVISSASASSVVVGGKNYALATDSAKFKVSTYGEFAKDDYVTLILGKDQEVVDIFKATTNDIGNKENDTSYSEVVSSTLKGPYIAQAGGTLDKLPFDVTKADIYKGSDIIEHNSIEEFDVYYYSELLNSVWIYRDTQTGTIEAVNPVISPTSVVVSGRTYSIEASQAAYDLSSLGSYHVGDDVTLLLAKDGVAGVIKPEKLSGTIFGVITEVGTKSFSKKNGTAYTADYVTVTDTRNITYTYEYDNRYYSVGDIVRVTYAGGTVISKVTSNSTSTGVAASLKLAIFNGNISNNCEIIDTYNGKTIKIYPSRIKGLDISLNSFTLGDGIVLYHSFDKDGKLDRLILNNFTGDLDEYGVAYGFNGTSFKYMTDSSVMTKQSETSVEGAVCIKDGTVFNELYAHINIELLSKTAAFDSNGNQYKLANNVKVFVRNGVSFEPSDIEDVINGKYTIKGYYDKPEERGGRIRVIIAQRAV